MSLLPVGFGSAADDAYEITDSLRFRSSASAYLSRTPASASNQTTWTFSVWVKRGALGIQQNLFNPARGGDGSNESQMGFRADDKLWIYDSGGLRGIFYTNQVFRDPSAWYHLVFVLDTTQATSTNRFKLYVNGEQATFSSATYPSQNIAWGWNSTQEHKIGVYAYSGSVYDFDGYLTEINHVDGQALTADDFGEYDANGTWKAKEYTGTYGTNGFYLPMKPTTQADGFNTVLYRAATTDGTYDIKGFGFNPDLIWIKNRDNVERHFLFDTVRGVDSSKALVSSDSSAEGTNGISGTTISTINDGFRIVESSINSGELYFNNRTYVAWGWDAGSGSAASNTNGSITSTVKTNDATGFSIVSYTGNGSNGATVGHGLSSTPETVIVKDRNNANNWAVYHKDLTSTSHSLVLNSSASQVDYGSSFIAPASSTLSLANGSQLNASSRAYIAYCFAEAAGYSKIGSYTGTGTTTGNVTTVGFRPAFLMIKATTTTAEWVILDNTRDPNPDPAKNVLHPNRTNADSTAAAGLYVKFTDTGFQPVGVGTDTNASGQTYIYMAFADTRDAVFNFDASGNKNNWLPNNINSSGESETTYDLMKDTPSLVDENAGNFATLNPLNEPRPYVTYSDANLTVTNTTSNAHSPFISTIGMAPNSGKYYWESIGVGNSNTRNATGIGTAESMPLTTLPVGFISGQAGFYIGSGTAVYFYDESGTSTFNVAWSAGNVFMHCYDANTGKFWIGQNGVWYNSSGGTTGDPATGANPTATFTNSNTYFPLGTVYNNSGSYLYYNFGQRPFAYTPPTGFLKLNTFNLPDSTIEDGSDYFNTVLYSGNSSTQSITGVGFQPDFVWAKDRTNVVHHTLNDAVRGVNLDLFTSSTSQESNDHAGLTAFTADGYNLSSSTNHNVSGHTYVGWNWKANGSGVSNTVGDITSTVSANTTAGFSIVSYAGNNGSNQTVGHGLGTTPSMFIIKNRTSAASWPVYHKDISSPLSNAMYLNSTNAAFGWAYWGTGGLSSTVFPVHYGSADVTNQSGKNYIAYVFAEVEGYSSFGSYTGNGSTDGTFVYTGFRPAWIMVKRYTAIGNWQMFDSSRDLYNPENGRLYANLADAESDQNSVDFVSNGFKLRDTSGDNNSSGQSYIYMAFAENPFKNALAR